MTERPSGGRAQATRQRLLEVSRKVFGERPLSAVRLKTDILDPAGVSVGSFYHQFEGKTELLLAMLEEHSEMFRQEFRKLAEPREDRDPESIARASFAFVFDMVDRDPDLMRVRLRGDGDTDPKIAAFLKRDALRWNESRVRDYERLVQAYDLDLDVRRAAEIIGVLMDGAIRYYLTVSPSKRPAVRRRLLEGIVQFALRGLPGLEATAD